MTDIGDPEIRAWLLRRLDARRSALLERQLFADVGLADRIDGIECDLIDDCAHGRLSVAEARIVRARDAWRVRFAQALAQLQRSDAAPKPSVRMRASALRRVGLGFAIAALLPLAVFALRWWTIASTHPAHRADAISLPVVTLLAGQPRGAAVPLALPAHSGNVRLQAEIDGSAGNGGARYALGISAAGRVVFVARDLEPRSAGPYRFVEAIVPGAILGPDARRVTVSEEGAPDSTASSWDVQAPASR